MGTHLQSLKSNLQILSQYSYYSFIDKVLVSQYTKIIMFTSALRRAIYKNYKPYRWAKDNGMGEYMVITTIVTPSTLVVLNILWNLNQSKSLSKNIASVCAENKIEKPKSV